MGEARKEGKRTDNAAIALSEPSPTHHVTALDGVRGVAILMVMLFHSLYLGFGWTGVQVFFVLSGYLITSVLLTDTDLSLSLYLKRFYWRRALRIFPLYFGVLTLIGTVYLLTGRPAAFGEFWLSLATYTYNYHALAALVKGWDILPLGHFWSLAVEEQFYLVWPLIVYLLPRRWLVLLTSSIILTCPLVRYMTFQYLRSHGAAPWLAGSGVYSFTFCQADALALGAWVALHRPHLVSHANRIVIIVFSAFVILAQVNSSLTHKGFALNRSFGYAPSPTMLYQNLQYVWEFSIINMAAAAVLILALKGGWMARMLSSAWLTYVGRISYGLYVFHQILQSLIASVFDRHGMGYDAVQLIFNGAAVLAVATLSYYGVEVRFLRMKNRWFRRPTPRVQVVAA